ncbi:hypothetical protein P9279_22085 [Mesorhizobium sp. WSM4962]|uniref:hypothetical protein n=1 Tax=Mesorhizobium sp. WSM4962 TaxID=3038548 RepID=UPI002416E948|nr:hypothetical protein [Mesorhizobium sp. WSM4962]MDG4903203.1 hypothetical protein [Mesorhizobium sp. WSM4962]
MNAKSNKIEITVGSTLGANPNLNPNPTVFIMPNGELSAEGKMKLSLFSAAVPALLNSGLTFDVFYNVDDNTIEVIAK